MVTAPTNTERDTLLLMLRCFLSCCLTTSTPLHFGKENLFSFRSVFVAPSAAERVGVPAVEAASTMA